MSDEYITEVKSFDGSNDDLRKKAKEFVCENIDKTEYGKISVELKGNSGKLDIVVQKRVRFEKNKKYREKGTFHKG